MLSKESKIRVLENFYALDYVFFGKPVTKMESCCPLVKEEYLSIKGALMSVFVETLKLVDHAPGVIDERVNSNHLMKNARMAAKIARENAQRIVSTDKSRAAIKESLKNMLKEDKSLDISATIESQIRTKAFSYAVDNLLLARVVSEAKAFEKLNEWEGTIIEDSYKILRDNLIESAYDILYSEDDILEEDEKKKVVNEAQDFIMEIAKVDGLLESILLLEKAGILSAAAAGIYAEYKCGLRGKDRLLKMQLGYRKCYWEKVIEYYGKRVNEYKQEQSAKCAKKTGDAKTTCLNNMKIKIAKTIRAMDNFKIKLAKVNERIAKKKGKTWKI